MLINPPASVVLSAKSFGAAGDGTTNDAAAINAAVASLPEGGGQIFFPQGVYVANSTIEVTKPSVSFVGVGWDQETLTAGSVIKGGAAATDLVKVTSAASTFQMATMWLDGNAKVTNVLNLESLNCQIQNASIRRPNTAGVGILAAGASPWLTNVRFNGANQAETTGFKINSTDATIAGCKPVNCQTSMELTSSASGAILSGNHMTPGGTIGKNCVWVSGNASNVSMVGNRIDNHLSGAGIHVDLAANANSINITNNLFFQNTIENEKFPAIGVDTSAGNIYGLTLTGNTVRSSASHVYLAFLAAIKRDGTAATNQARIASMGTVSVGNAAYAKEMYGTLSTPKTLTLANSFSSDGTTWSAA